MIIAPFILASHLYGSSGWEGYSWEATSKASVDFTVPHVHAPDGSVAFWAGLGSGDPGIQQTGITCTWDNGFGGCNDWYEMWPAPGVAFPGQVHEGDHMRFYVARTGNDYLLQVFDYTRHWTNTAHARYGAHEDTGEAIAEAFGPPLPGFTPASFTHASGVFDFLYTFPFGGASIHRDSSTSFTVHRL